MKAYIFICTIIICFILTSCSQINTNSSSIKTIAPDYQSSSSQIYNSSSDITIGVLDETLIKYFNYVNENNNITMLFNHDANLNGFTDSEMAAYAICEFIKNNSYDYNTGNSKEEFNKITEKYFGKRIQNFDNEKSMVITKTGNVTSTGWGKSNIYMVLKELNNDDDKTKTAVFYATIGDIAGSSAELNTVIKDMIMHNCDVLLIKINFEEKLDENGNMYFKYISANNLGVTSEEISLYKTNT